MFRARERFWIPVFVLALACGSKKTEDPKKTEDKTPTQTSPTSALTPEPAPSKAPSAFDLFPGSTFVAGVMLKPQASISTMQDLWKKTGVSLEVGEVKKAYEEMKAEIGFDPLDPEVLKKAGIDGQRPVAFGVDGKLLTRSLYNDSYAGITSERLSPVPYLVFSLSDPKAFDTWLKDVVSKSSSSRYPYQPPAGGEEEIKKNNQYTLVEETWGEQKVSYIESKYHSMGALVTVGDTVYFFIAGMDKEDFNDFNYAIAKEPAVPGVAPASAPVPPTPSTSLAAQALATFKTDLKGFFERLKTPLSRDAALQDAIVKVTPNGDGYFFVHINNIIDTIAATENSQKTYSTPKDEEQRQRQEEEKKYDEERRKESAGVLDVMRALLGDVKWGAGSMTLSEKGLVTEGRAALSGQLAKAVEKIFSSSPEAPNYPALFSEKTLYFSRYTISLSALMTEITARVPASAKEDFANLLTQAQGGLGMVGLDLEKDLLGAFTGNFAMGFSDISSQMAPFLALSAFSPTSLSLVSMFTFVMFMGGVDALPPGLLVAQLTSPAAGDKLLTALDTGLSFLTAATQEVKVSKQGEVRMITYQMASSAGFMDPEGKTPPKMIPVTIAIGRVDDLFLVSTDPALVTEASAHLKSPGASFAARFGSALTKDLVTQKGVTGTTVDLAGILAVAMKSQELASAPPEVQELVNKLSAKVGAQTSVIRYEDSAILYKSEMSLR